MNRSFRRFALPLALALCPLAGCNKTEGAATDITNAAKKVAESVDFSKLSGDALKTQVGQTFTNLTAGLNSIKDEATAKDLIGKFGPMIDSLTSMKSKLAGNLPDTSAITKALGDVAAKFKGQEGIMKVLQPFLDKVTALLK
jgi:predicted small secreted protein